MNTLYAGDAPPYPDWVDSTTRLDWRESIPVLHLAMAVRHGWINLYAAHPEWRERYFAECMIANPIWVAEVIALTESLRVLLPRVLPDLPAERLVPMAAAPSVTEAKRLYAERAISAG